MRIQLSCTLLSVLAVVAVRAQEPSDGPFDRGMAFYWANQMDSAAVYLLDAARAAPTDPERWAWLAEAKRREGDPGGAAAAARAALVLGPCNAFAHTVLASALNPMYSGWEGTDADLAWRHSRSATRCDPSDGNAWLNVVFQAMQRGQRSVMDSALAKLIATGFLQSSALAFSHWVLDALPPNALLLTNGDMDTYPLLAVQVAEDARSDVAVVNVSLLNTNWYGDTVAVLYRLPPVSSIHGDAATGAWGLEIAALWVRASMAGQLRRTVALAPSVSGEVREALPGPWQFAGTHWRLATNGAAPSDTTSLRAALASVTPFSWRGPSTSDRDRSPIRRRSNGALPILPLMAALRYGCALQGSGDPTAAHDIAQWMRDFAGATGVENEWVDGVLEAIGDGFPVGTRWCES
jgi:hypothetical protein